MTALFSASEAEAKAKRICSISSTLLALKAGLRRRVLLFVQVQHQQHDREHDNCPGRHPEKIVETSLGFRDPVLAQDTNGDRPRSSTRNPNPHLLKETKKAKKGEGVPTLRIELGGRGRATCSLVFFAPSFVSFGSIVLPSRGLSSQKNMMLRLCRAKGLRVCHPPLSVVRPPSPDAGRMLATRTARGVLEAICP
jgi:hypothetical protein